MKAYSPLERTISFVIILLTFPCFRTLSVFLDLVVSRIFSSRTISTHI
jgi:hypothetical protein